MKSRVLATLLTICIVLHLIAMCIPALASLVSGLENLGWFVTLVVICIWFVQAIKTMISKKPWRKYVPFQKVVPVAQLKLVCNDVECLRLALHGMTPEAEKARRMYFQMRGEPLPALVVPPQHACLYAEFESLVQMLTHFGFPFSLPQKDLAFIQASISNLQMRLSQHQQETLAQKQALEVALSNLVGQHQKLGTTIMCNDPGFQRIDGALRLLDLMNKDWRVSPETSLTYVHKVQKELECLTKPYENIVVRS